MTDVTIGEPIEMLVWFAPGGLQPLRFRWQQRVYRVAAVNGQWREHDGARERWHFSVQVGDETMFLHLALPALRWVLDAMAVP